MKTTIEYDFEGCFDCPHSSEFTQCSVLPMGIFCQHPSWEMVHKDTPKIMGGTRASCILKDGQKYPEWCPVKRLE